MPIATTNLLIDQGATFIVEWTWEQDGEVVDLTGYTARGMIRKTPLSALLLDLEPYLDIDGPNGKVTLNIPDSVTDDLTWVNFALFDIELERSGIVYRFLEGKVALNKEVTHG